jgi:hypothetical protein
MIYNNIRKKVSRSESLVYLISEKQRFAISFDLI